MIVESGKYHIDYTDRKKTDDGTEVYRVVADRDIAPWGVKKGDGGGYVGNAANLSQDGNCWIADNAVVYGNAKVEGDAIVEDDAKVYDDARVHGNAVVDGNAVVRGNAVVSGDAAICNDAVVGGHARVRGRSRVHGSATVGGDTVIDCNADIMGNAVVDGSSSVEGTVLGTSHVGGSFVSSEAVILDAEIVEPEDYAVYPPFRHDDSNGLCPITYTKRNGRWCVLCGLTYRVLDDDGFAAMPANPVNREIAALYVRARKLADCVQEDE